MFDEAHHLKYACWNSHIRLKDIVGMKFVARTATPPYDSEARGIQHYFELCGPIDEEIPVPELIQNGYLCPRQDVIYFSTLKASGIRHLVACRESIMTITNGLSTNTAFQEFLRHTHLYSRLKEHLDTIYTAPYFPRPFSST